MVRKALLIFCCVSYISAAPNSPNIVFILADDLGWNDIGYNNPDIISPNINNLANNGIIFNQSYVQPVCTPSRVALMTGYYPFRVGMQHLVIFQQDSRCAPKNTFLPEMLKTKGYMTHMMGKWHLGYCNWNCTPTYRGFDSFYGHYSSGNDFYTKMTGPGFDFRFNEGVDRSAAGNYSTLQYADRAEEIIRSHNQSKPLFIYLAFNAIHTPLQAPDKYTAMYPNIENEYRKIGSAMVTAIDDAIGQVVDALKDTGLYDNTMIIFSSDNGGHTGYGGNNYPLRGGKLSLFEGGTRVPAFMHSPLLEKSGVFTGMIHVVDWFPTISEIIGARYKKTGQDGVSQWKAIRTLGKPIRKGFVYNVDFHPQPLSGTSAIRVGDYKLMTGFPGLYQGWPKPEDEDQGPFLGSNPLTDIRFNVRIAREVFTNDTLEHNYLFNLKEDPEERHNLYYQLPNKVKKMELKLLKAVGYDEKCPTPLSSFLQRAFPNRYLEPVAGDNNPKGDPSLHDGVYSPGWC